MADQGCAEKNPYQTLFDIGRKQEGDIEGTQENIERDAQRAANGPDSNPKLTNTAIHTEETDEVYVFVIVCY